MIDKFSLYYPFSVVENGCAHLSQESPSPAAEVEYTPMKWFETPSIVSYASGDIYNNLFYKKRERITERANDYMSIEFD